MHVKRVENSKIRINIKKNIDQKAVMTQHTVVPFVLLALIKNDQVLLIRRSNTGFSDGMYSLIGGKVEKGETMRAALVREAFEEIDVIIDPDDLAFVHAFHRKGDAEELVAFCFATTHWLEEPHNKEPEKHDDLRWFPLDRLPSNMIPANKQAVESIVQGRYYSEHGWDE